MKIVIKKDKIEAFLIFYLIYISTSSLVTGFFGFNLVITFFLITSIYLLFSFYNGTISNKVFILLLFLPLIVLLISIYLGSSLYFNRYIFISIFILISILISKKERVLSFLVKISTSYILIALIAAWLSFVYFYFGGVISSSFPNPDGRPNNIILFSFSNAVYSNVMRPSFIYDEPGAFSFFICSVVLLREIMGSRKSVSILILVLGLVTFSLMHLIVLFVYLLFSISTKGKVVVLTVLLSIIFSTINNPSFDFVYNRFKIENGKLSGDNRSGQIDNYLRVVDQHMFIFGNEKCFINGENICREDHGDISSNPLTPLYQGGVFILSLQVFYYILIAYSIYVNKFRKNILSSLVIIFLLSLQRPFMFTVTYTIPYFLILFITLKTDKR